MSVRQPLIYLVAGGTGGHINAAIALSEKLPHYKTQFISSDRKIDKRILKNYPAWHLPAKALKGRGLVETVINLLWNLYVFFNVFFKALFSRPELAIGLGGFICGPVLFACYLLRIKVYTVEQNSVMGLANKALVPMSQKVFTHFENTIGFPKRFENKIIKAGNPIRSSIHYSFKPRGDEFNILIFGGSLGAREINECVEKVFKTDRSFKINIRHQVGQGNEMKIQTGANINYEQVDYIDDIDQAYAWCDLIISRGGASTISELKIVKKPVFIFPYPHSDQHQKFNALNLQKESSFDVEFVEIGDDFNKKCEKLNEFIEQVYKSTPVDFSLIKNHDPRDIILKEVGVIL